MSAPQGQQFSLKWNNFSQHIVNAFEDLRGDDDFTDVTLSCEGKRVKCHKVLLSACSVYFKETFRENPCKHPVIILKGVEYVDLQAVVTFMYNGQVNISQERLSTFLQTAELLQIKGLTEMNDTEEAPTVKKRSHTAGTSEPAIPSLSHSLKSGDGSLITPEIVTARPPTPKRKRIGPASFMQMQNQSHSNNDSQVPVTTQAGSSFHSSSANLERGSGGGGLSVMDGTSDTKVVAGPSGGVSSSTGGFINPETVIIPSTSMLDPSGTHLSSSNDSYSHGIIKFEEEDMLDEDDDYEKNNLSEDNDNSLHDMLGNVEHEHGSMGSFMAGPSGQGIKILNVGTDSSAHGDDDDEAHYKISLSLTQKKRPKLTVGPYSYLLQSVNQKGHQQWRCLTWWKTRCKGRLRKVDNQYVFTRKHSMNCDQRRENKIPESTESVSGASTGKV